MKIEGIIPLWGGGFVHVKAEYIISTYGKGYTFIDQEILIPMGIIHLPPSTMVQNLLKGMGFLSLFWADIDGILDNFSMTIVLESKVK